MPTREDAPLDPQGRRSLSPEHDLALIRSVIEDVVLVDVLDAETGIDGLAACELLARFRGDGRLRAAIPEVLFETAVRAIDRLEAGSRGVLEYWFATTDSSAWSRRLDELRARLAQSGV